MIKHLYLKNWTAAQIKAELDEVHGGSAPALKMVYSWINEFQRGLTSTEDEARSGRPVEVTTKEMVEKNHGIILEDRRVKVREIVETVGISTERVHNILHGILEMKKVCARWVPKLLTVDRKCARKETSVQCLAMLKRNPKDFWRRFVTVDEAWIHH